MNYAHRITDWFSYPAFLCRLKTQVFTCISWTTETYTLYPKATANSYTKPSTNFPNTL